MTTQHDTKKRWDSFGPFLTTILTFKWVKVSLSFNFMFFFHDPRRSDSIQVDLPVFRLRILNYTYWVFERCQFWPSVKSLKVSFTRKILFNSTLR